MSNNFRKTSLLKLLALEKGLKKNWRDVAVPGSVQSCFELSIHLSVK